MATVIWSNQAELDYYENIDYLLENWGLVATRNFIEKVDATISILVKGNVTFKPTDYKGVFEVLIVKQISLYYRTDEVSIELIRF